MFDWLTRAQLFTLDTALITTLLVVSVHMVFRCGIFSLGTMGFAALGGYTSAILVTEHGWPTWGGIASGVVVAGVIAAVFAGPVLRLRGIYLALGSLALSEIIRVIITNVDFTNGLLGISQIPRDVKTNHLLIILAVLFIVLQLESRSHFGRAIRAVRLDERTASGFGINVRLLRFNAFVLSAMLAGLAGALEAHRTSTITPDQYRFGALVPLFAYALIGGNDHWIGPVLTAWGLTLLRYWADFDDKHWENIAYGTLIVVVVILAPGGLTDPAFLRKFRRRHRAEPDEPPGHGETVRPTSPSSKFNRTGTQPEISSSPTEGNVDAIQT